MSKFEEMDLIMISSDMRQRLIQYIDGADEKLLELLLAVTQAYYEDSDGETTLTEEDILLLKERREKWLSGDSKGYSWSEAKRIIRGKRKSDEL